MIFAAVESFERISNQIEAVFWMAIGVVFLLYAMRLALRRDKLAAAIVFIAFGGSDVVESTTGAWWTPWWLLVWKGLCVLALVMLYVRYERRRRRLRRPLERQQ